MAKTDYITNGYFRLQVYQSDIINASAADPYVQVTVYLQAYSNGQGITYAQDDFANFMSLSGSLCNSAYTYSGKVTDVDPWSSGWKTIGTIFYQKGIWSVSKTRTAFNVSLSGTCYVYPESGMMRTYSISLSGNVSMQAWPVSGTKDTASIPSSMTMGSTYTISISHKTSGNKNTLTWKFGSQSGTILSSSTATSASFTPATSLGSQIPSANSGTVAFTLTTYNSSGVNLGSTSYSSTLSVPSYSIATPTVSAAKNSYTGVGAYVANKTRTRFTLSGLPSGSYGASVTGSYVIKLAGTQQTSGTKSGTSSSSVDYTAAGAGALQLTYTVKDSRGKTNSASASVTYVANAAPTISFSADRDASTPTNWSGTATGTYLNVSGNTATITFTEGTAGTNTASGGAVSRTVSGTCAETSTLAIKATITDSLGNTASRTITIATVFAFMECTPNRVIAFGRKADTSVSDRIQIGLDIYQTNNAKIYQYWNGVMRAYFEAGDIYLYSSSGAQGFHADSAGKIYPLQSTSNYISDFVYSRTSPSGWRIVRWNSGWTECWYSRTYTGAVNIAWGNIYASASLSSLTYPVTFTSVPYEQVTVTGSSSSGSSNASAWVIQSGNTSGPTTTNSGQYQVCRPNTNANAHYTLTYHVAGWTS